jgi:hypothetical protein
MQATKQFTSAQQSGATVQPVRSPVVLAPEMLKLVSGGAPKGGWALATEDATLAPKGGW